MTDLLPCPFCGGEASADGVTRYCDAMVKEQGWGQSEFYFCNCTRCGATNKGLVGHETKSDAIAAWNRRTAHPSLLEEWRDMDSAPKDGTHVLVCFGPYDEWTTFAQRPATVAHWFGPPPLPGLRAGGWYPSVQTYDGNERLHPTHWMHLPDAPSALLTKLEVGR